MTGKKLKSIFILLVAVLVSLASFSVMTDADGAKYFIDETMNAPDAALDAANELADDIYDEYGIEVLMLITDDYHQGANSLGKYAENYGGIGISKQDSVMLVLNEDEGEYVVRKTGKCDGMFTNAECEGFWDAYNYEMSYADGFTAYLNSAKSIISRSSAAGTGSVTSGAQSKVSQSTYPRLMDEAGLLSSDEAAEIKAKLDEISERQKFDVVIATVNSLSGKTPREYADDLYDYSGFGFGENKDGVLFLISMEDRDWYISTTGYGIAAITDAGREYIADKFTGYLSDGDYAEAFRIYANEVDRFVTNAVETGKPYDVGNLPHDPLSLIWIPISLVVGLIIAAGVVGGMKSKLRSVNFAAAADSYVKPGSMNVRESRDMFLYSTVSRTAKPKDSDSSGSSGGSSTHTSSSGTTHGGGGGKF